MGCPGSGPPSGSAGRGRHRGCFRQYATCVPRSRSSSGRHQHSVDTRATWSPPRTRSPRQAQHQPRSRALSFPSHGAPRTSRHHSGARLQSASDGPQGEAGAKETGRAVSPARLLDHMQHLRHRPPKAADGHSERGPGGPPRLCSLARDPSCRETTQESRAADPGRLCHPAVQPLHTGKPGPKAPGPQARGEERTLLCRGGQGAALPTAGR